MKEEKSGKRAFLRGDILFIGILLAVCAVGMLYLFVFRAGGNTVRVTVDGELYGVYSLTQDTVRDIESGDAQLNRLSIRDGKAYMESATCPDGICVAHKPIFRDGESIICLPNKVVVTVITEDGADSPDIVA